MCITIPSSANVKRARQWAVWGWLASSPLRLFLVGGLLPLGLALAAGWTAAEPGVGWRQFNLLFAVVPGLLLGPLLEYLPRLLKVTPPTYVRFASLYFLLLLTQLIHLVDSLRSVAPGPVYLAALALIWGGSLTTLRNMLRLSYAAIAGMAAAVLHLWLLAGAIGLLIALALGFGWLPALPDYAWSALAPLYLSLLLVLVLLHRQALYSSRT